MTDKLKREELGQLQAGDILLFVHPLPCTQTWSSITVPGDDDTSGTSRSAAFIQ